MILHCSCQTNGSIGDKLTISVDFPTLGDTTRQQSRDRNDCHYFRNLVFIIRTHLFMERLQTSLFVSKESILITEKGSIDLYNISTLFIRLSAMIMCLLRVQ